jgi:hypothetical protein
MFPRDTGTSAEALALDHPSARASSDIVCDRQAIATPAHRSAPPSGDGACDRLARPRACFAASVDLASQVASEPTTRKPDGLGEERRPELCLRKRWHRTVASTSRPCSASEFVTIDSRCRMPMFLFLPWASGSIHSRDQVGLAVAGLVRRVLGQRPCGCRPRPCRGVAPRNDISKWSYVKERFD